MGFLSAPGPLEIMVILALALIVLGPSRLPDVARSVGKGMREFRESLSGFGDDDEDEDPYDEDELESDPPHEELDEEFIEEKDEELEAASVQDPAPARDS